MTEVQKEKRREAVRRYRAKAKLDPAFNARQNELAKTRRKADPEHRAKKNAAARKQSYSRSRDPARWVRLVLGNTRKRCARKGIPFDVTADDISLPSHCAITGAVIGYADKSDRWAWPSLDRMRPELGYVKGNVRVVSMRGNFLKSNGSLDEMRRVVQDLERIHGEAPCPVCTQSRGTATAATSP